MTTDLPILPLSLPTPYPVGPVTAYLLMGPEPTLIDTGLGTPTYLAALHAALAAAGRRVDEIRQLLLTHGHLDHAGAAFQLAQTCPAQLFLHERSTLFTRGEPELRERMLAYLTRCGVAPTLAYTVLTEFSLHRGAPESVAPARLRRLQGGEQLKAGSWTLQAVATPGHCPDHLCFFERATGTLFCGDMLLERITPNPLLYLDPTRGYRRVPALLDYLASLDRLATLPIRQGLPGHGPPLTDVAAVIARNRRFIERRRLLFLRRLERQSLTPDQLATAVFHAADPTNQYLAVSETLAYLDLLERQTEVEVDWEAPRITIRASPAALLAMERETGNDGVRDPTRW